MRVTASRRSGFDLLLDVLDLGPDLREAIPRLRRGLLWTSPLVGLVLGHGRSPCDGCVRKTTIISGRVEEEKPRSKAPILSDRSPIEAFVYWRASELRELSGCENRIAHQAGFAPLANQLDGIAECDDCQNLDRLRQQRPTDHRTDVDLIDCHGRLILGRLRPRKQRRLRNETLPTDDIKQS